MKQELLRFNLPIYRENRVSFALLAQKTKIVSTSFAIGVLFVLSIANAVVADSISCQQELEQLKEMRDKGETEAARKLEQSNLEIDSLKKELRLVNLELTKNASENRQLRKEIARSTQDENDWDGADSCMVRGRLTPKSVLGVVSIDIDPFANTSKACERVPRTVWYGSQNGVTDIVKEADCAKIVTVRYGEDPLGFANTADVSTFYQRTEELGLEFLNVVTITNNLDFLIMWHLKNQGAACATDSLDVEMVLFDRKNQTLERSSLSIEWSKRRASLKTVGDHVYETLTATGWGRPVSLSEEE